MKRRLSIVAVAARSSICQILGVLVLMAAAEGGMFWISIKKYSQFGLEKVISESGVYWFFLAAYILICILLCRMGYEAGGVKLRYTLRRLSLKEETFVFWVAIYNTVCFFLLWIAQVMIVLGLYKFYVSQIDSSVLNTQSIFLAFYRNSFLHSLLPLEDISRYVRNILMVMGLGICSAAFPYKLRQDKKGLAIFFLAPVVPAVFGMAMGNVPIDIFVSIYVVSVSISAIYGARRKDYYET